MEELKNKIILKKYKIIKRIGKGSFGSVYLGKYVNKNEYVAIKFESKNQNDTILEREAYILYSLKGF
jgi:serine/threonine protein kinase